MIVIPKGYCKELVETNVRNGPRNRYVQDIELPKPLRRRLVFGDTNQISALNCLEKRIDREASRKAKIESGNVNTYSVTLVYSTTETIQVIAVDQEDAEEKAIALSEHDGLGFGEVDIESIDKIEGEK